MPTDYDALRIKPAKITNYSNWKEFFERVEQNPRVLVHFDRENSNLHVTEDYFKAVPIIFEVYDWDKDELLVLTRTFDFSDKMFTKGSFPFYGMFNAHFLEKFLTDAINAQGFSAKAGLSPIIER
jgi:hypothetical protein